MKKVELINIINCQNLLGEGVQWNSQDQSFWWTDILSKKIYRYQLANNDLQEWSLPERLGCFAFVDNKTEILAAFESGFAWYQIANGECEWISKPEAHWQGNRLNDGRCDRQGRFWSGSITEQKNHPSQSAGLFCLDSTLKTSQHLNGLRISNALCWSRDSSKIYHADSPSQSVRVYDFDANTGRLGDSRIFAQTEAGVEPDGACVDADDYVWNAQWGGSRVVRYSPDGATDFVLPMPVSQATCVAFGGDDYSILAVTSARIGLDDTALELQPDAGNLFIFKTTFTGLPESRFVLNGANPKA
jgi:L-arabinonolactonase